MKKKVRKPITRTEFAAEYAAIRADTMYLKSKLNGILPQLRKLVRRAWTLYCRADNDLYVLDQRRVRVPMFKSVAKKMRVLGDLSNFDMIDFAQFIRELSV